MKTESLWGGVKRKRLNVINVFLLFPSNWTVIQPASREFVSILNNSIIDVCPQNCDDESGILIIGDSASVVDFSTDIVEGLERDLFVSFNKGFQLASADDEIFIGKSVRDVPTDRAKLPSILNDSVEEGKAEQKLFVGLGFGALFKVLDVKSFVSTKDILSESARRLKSHLD
jgi:hypothetical protein